MVRGQQRAENTIDDSIDTFTIQGLDYAYRKSVLTRPGNVALTLRQACEEDERLDIGLFLVVFSALAPCAFSMLEVRGVCYDAGQRIPKSCSHPLSLSLPMANDLILDNAKSGENRRSV